MLLRCPLLKGILFGLLCFVCASLGAQANYFNYVVIDPGHGGHDLGGHYGKVYEKHLALDTSMRLEHYLKASGYKTVMTRRSDSFISLPRRAAMGNRYRNSIFVSIHYNYTWKRDVCGLETFYHSRASKPLADYINDGMLRRTKVSNRGVKFTRYYVIRNARNPAVLVECGFVSNSRERARMKDGSYRDAIARGIAEGIAKFRKSN